MTTVTVTQGADCTIQVTGIVDADGATLDLSNWTIVAQARERPGSTLLAEWSDSPTGDQGTATGNADGSVGLDVPAAMSDGWSFSRALLHVEAHEPVGDEREARVGEANVYVSPAIVA